MSSSVQQSQRHEADSPFTRRCLGYQARHVDKTKFYQRQCFDYENFSLPPRPYNASLHIPDLVMA